MAFRRIYNTGFSLFNRAGVRPISASYSNVRLLNFAVNYGTSNSYVKYGNFAGAAFMSNSNTIDRRMISTKQKVKSSPEILTVNMGSILEHHKYKEIESKLAKMNRKSLRPLDTASLYILSSKELNVNLEILRLDALSPQSHLSSSYKGSVEIQEMKQCGAVKKGKLNKEDETAIEKRFETLLAETGLDKEALMEELFAANEGSSFN